MLRDVAAELARLDAPWAERRPDLIRAKRARMKTSALAFLRASAPIFFVRLREALGPDEPLGRWLDGAADAPVRVVWCAGDAHVENFGAYRSADGRERFGLNDFDDALPAPLEVDVLRLAASVLVAARAKGKDGPAALALARRFLAGYAKHTGEDTADPGEKEVASSVAKLLDAAKDSSRESFLDKRAPARKGERAFETSDRYPALDAARRARAVAAFEASARPLAPSDKPGFYQVVDIAGRVAGLGSLGCGRFAVLVKGGKANVLMELKEAKPASLVRHGCPQGAPPDEAARVVAAQVALRGERSPHLGTAILDERSYYFRRLHHQEQRVDLDDVKPGQLDDVIDAEAIALARAHGRSRRALALSPLARPTDVELEAWLLLATRLAGCVEGDYLAFCAAALER